MANSLCLLTVGNEISEMDTENKMIKLWNREAQKEVPTEVPVVTGLIGQEITLGLIRQTVDRVAKADDGSYVPTGETREENEIDKFFRAKDKLTTAEIRGQIEEPGFFNAWKNKWDGQTRDKSTQNSGSTSSKVSGALSGTNRSSSKPTESLFK